MDADLLDHAVAHLRRARTHSTVPCKVCGAVSALFDMLDFNKTCHDALYPAGLVAVPVLYRRCADCSFIFTDFFDDFTPQQWSTHLYNAAYYERVDPAYADERPANNARGLDHLLRPVKDRTIGLDYGGGSGRTCAHLRAMGYRYDTVDPFGARSLTPEYAGRYDFCTAFEVAEHTPDPCGFLRAIVDLATPGRLAVLVGTQLHDGIVTDATRLSWWYAAPRNGHISLYSRRSLQLLARQVGLDYTPFSSRTHLFTRQWSAREARWFLLRGKLAARLGRWARSESPASSVAARSLPR